MRRFWNGNRDDEEAVMGTGVSPCNDCARRWSSGRACDAFPQGIPIEVLAGDVAHDRPLPDLGQTNRLIRVPRTPGASSDEMR